MKCTGKFFGTGPLAAMLAILAMALPVAADDTEIYFEKASPSKPKPVVMLTLDYRPNVANAKVCGDAATCKAYMGDEIFAQLDPAALASGNVTLFDSFRAVFKLVFASDVFDGMRIGLMMSHANCLSGGSCGSKSNGGYVLRGAEEFQAGDGNHAKQELNDIFSALPRDVNGSTHPYQGQELFFEMYRYLAGLDVLNGHKGYADFDSASTDRNLDHEFTVGRSTVDPKKCLFSKTAITGDNRLCEDYTLPAGYSIKDDSNYRTVAKVKGSCPAGSTAIGGTCYVRISSALTWDLSIETTPAISPPAPARYKDPLEDGDWSCTDIYSINLLFQVSNGDDDSNTDIQKSLANQGLGYTPGSGGNGFPSIIAKLHNMDIRQGQAGTKNIAGEQALTSFFLVDKLDTKTTEYAINGGTSRARVALDNPKNLLDELKAAAREINSKSSTYVAVTVPVNADNRVTSLPNMFVALFQVDEHGKPYWPGNVKKLDVEESDPDPVTGAKTLSVNDALGAAAFNPVTGRIKDSALTVWTDPGAADVVAADTSLGEVPGRDGSSVRRGGAGHKIPGYRSGGVGTNNGATGARQIFIDPATVTGSAAAGNPMVPLDASSASALRNDPDIQKLLGIRDPTGACPGWDGATDNFCMTFIGDVLTTAKTSTSGLTTNALKAERATLLFLRWIRGFDVFNEAGSGSPPDGFTTSAQRKWMMGDVLHSRPVAVNYGKRSGYGTDNQDVRLIFGANDGLLRMVRNTAAGTSEPADVPTQQGDAYGQEVWAFLPRELLAHVPQLAMDFGDVGLNRPYGADGPPTLFTIDTNGDGTIDNDGSCTVGADDCDRAWIYFGLRRGGKSYYAVDVSFPDATTPKLLWKIDSTMADFTELGMTFSTPRVGWVRFEDVTGLNQFGSPAANVPVPVVIFGGGYNGHAVTGGDHHQSGTGGPSKDTILGTPFIDADTQGNALYIVQARTGQLIWKATSTGTASATHYVNAMMQHGIAAPVSPMDSDGDGILDRLYVADTGGRVWRVDLPEFVPGGTPAVTRTSSWKATVLADLRPSAATLATSTTDDLRFFHGATIVRKAKDSIGDYDALFVGSGDREHPQTDTYYVTSGGSTTTVTKTNWFFLFKDRLTTSGDSGVASRAAVVPSDLLDVTDACFNGSTTPTCSATDLSKGWRLKLEEPGEKNLSEPFIGGEGVIFTTYLPRGTTPDDKPCVPLGQSRLYQVSLDTGAPLRFLHSVVGDTFDKTDRWINLYAGLDGGVVAVSPDFWITSTGKSGSNPPQKPIGFYWRESGVDAVK